MSKRAKATLNITLRNNDTVRAHLSKAGQPFVHQEVKEWTDVELLLKEVMPMAERRQRTRAKARHNKKVSRESQIGQSGFNSKLEPAGSAFKKIIHAKTTDGPHVDLDVTPDPATRTATCTREEWNEIQRQIRYMAINDAIRMRNEQAMAPLTDLELKVRLLSLNIYKLINKYAQFRLKLRSFFYRYFFKPFF